MTAFIHSFRRAPAITYTSVPSLLPPRGWVDPRPVVSAQPRVRVASTLLASVRMDPFEQILAQAAATQNQCCFCVRCVLFCWRGRRCCWCCCCCMCCCCCCCCETLGRARDFDSCRQTHPPKVLITFADLCRSASYSDHHDRIQQTENKLGF